MSVTSLLWFSSFFCAVCDVCWGMMYSRSLSSLTQSSWYFITNSKVVDLKNIISHLACNSVTIQTGSSVYLVLWNKVHWSPSEETWCDFLFKHTDISVNCPLITKTVIIYHSTWSWSLLFSYFLFYFEIMPSCVTCCFSVPPSERFPSF